MKINEVNEMKNKSLRFYWKIFKTTFTLSVFTFGGGYVIVSFMRDVFVEKYKWLDEEEMLNLVALAQSAPGAVAINTSVLVGYRLAGVPGAVVSVLGTALPPLIILSVISLFYIQFKSNPHVNAFMLGTGAGVAAVICNVVAKMVKSLLKERANYKVYIFLFALLGNLLLGIDVRLIILICGLIGLFIAYKKKQSEEKAVK